MNALVDAAVLLIITLAAIAGWHRGGLVVLGVTGGLLVGATVGTILVHPIVSVRGWSRIAPFVVGAAAISLGIVLGKLAVHWRDRMPSGPQRLDAAVGSAAAVLITLSIAWFILPNLARGPLSGLTSAISRSGAVRVLGDALPPPPDLLVSLDHAADLLGVPGAFASVPPVPAPPVEGVAPADLGTVAPRALASSIEVLGKGCIPGFLNEGSGVVVAPGYVVTSAHVLAGTHDQFLYDGHRYPATVVAFDPRLDVAVVYAPSFRAPALTLQTVPPDRGTWGVTAGFPGGYHPTVTPAVVRRSFSITGRDIYGQEAVSRTLIELQDRVEGGDSGGPLVLADGSLAGIVFAGSHVDGDVSYAVAGASLVPIIHAAVGSDQPVNVGSCVSSP